MIRPLTRQGGASHQASRRRDRHRRRLVLVERLDDVTSAVRRRGRRPGQVVDQTTGATGSRWSTDMTRHRRFIAGRPGYAPLEPAGRATCPVPAYPRRGALPKASSSAACRVAAFIWPMWRPITVPSGEMKKVMGSPTKP